MGHEEDSSGRKGRLGCRRPGGTWDNVVCSWEHMSASHCPENQPSNWQLDVVLEALFSWSSPELLCRVGAGGGVSEDGEEKGRRARPRESEGGAEEVEMMVRGLGV